jgi:hypothetical protein
MAPVRGVVAFLSSSTGILPLAQRRHRAALLQQDL